MILFFYTMAVFVCSIFISAVSFSAFIVTRQKTFALATAAYLFYFFDVALVFRTAYVDTQSTFHAVYTITSPVESVILGAGVFGCLWAIGCRFMEFSMRPAIIVVILFVTFSAVTYLGIADPRNREFTFFTARSLMVLALVTFGLWGYARSVDHLERKRLKSHAPLLLFMFITGLGTIAWNVYFLYVRPSLFATDVPPFLPERNFMENALLLGIGAWCVRSAVRRLQLFYERTPARPTAAREKFLASEVDAFATKHSLSKRESEIFLEIMRGKSYPAIASQRFISPSTVKVHIHNILKKTCQPDRDSLVRHFWHSA